MQGFHPILLLVLFTGIECMSTKGTFFRKGISNDTFITCEINLSKTSKIKCTLEAALKRYPLMIINKENASYVQQPGDEVYREYNSMYRGTRYRR